MRILMTVASKHGGTSEIGDYIAQSLRDSGFEVDVLVPESVSSIAPYDAVIIGSAVYAGHWMAAARSFVSERCGELAGLPVWLFSSGPIGDPPKPGDDPADVQGLVEATLAREHRQFAGRLDPQELGIGERLVTSLVRAKAGDFRPWPEVARWADTIAHALRPSPTVAGLA